MLVGVASEKRLAKAATQVLMNRAQFMGRRPGLRFLNSATAGRICSPLRYQHATAERRSWRRRCSSTSQGLAGGMLALQASTKECTNGQGSNHFSSIEDAALGHAHARPNASLLAAEASRKVAGWEGWRRSTAGTPLQFCCQPAVHTCRTWPLVIWPCYYPSGE